MNRRQFLNNSAATIAAAAVFSKSALPAPAVVPPAPREGDWPQHGHDLRNTRWNPHEKTISKDNVGRLKVKWKFDLDVPMDSTPAVAGDTVYVGAPGAYYAVDLGTGKQKWKYSMADEGGAQRVRKGVQYYDGRIYSGDSGGKMDCLDAATGKKLWERDFSGFTEPPNLSVVQKGISITGACIAFDGKIYFGTTGIKNRVVCLNADNGTTAWEYWITGEHDVGKGGSMWSSPALDERERILYVVTGSNKFPGANDPALFTESILAFDADTGYLRWFYQAHPNDPHDMDFNCHPMIFDAAAPPMKKGGVRQCVAAGNKDGMYCFDRYSGELFWYVQLTPRYVWGGPNVDSIAYDSNRVYVVSNAPTQILGKQAISVTAALDAYSGRIVWWTYTLGGIIQSGVGGANGVFYQGFNDGRLEALDADSGKVLWQFSLPTSKRGGFAISNGALYCCTGIPGAEAEGGAPGYTPPAAAEKDRKFGAYSLWCFTVDGK